MINLADVEELKKKDPQDTITTTGLANEQAKAAWNEVKKLPIKPFETKITSVVFCGMGASIYGALVLKALFGESLRFPIELISDYHLPKYVNSSTLVVLTSYSGTTEEVLSCAKEAKAMNTNILVLTKGGPLAEFAKENNVPAYIFDGKLNLSSTPRLGNGYTVVGLLGLFNKLGLISVDEEVLQKAFTFIDKNLETIKRRAQKDCEILENKVPIIFAAEHLSGNAQIMRNQFNETSKTFSAYYLIPDLNHHLMEGLQFPIKNDLYFLVVTSKNYSEKIQKRVRLTKDVVEQNKRPIVEYATTGENAYEDFLEVLTYGSWLTLYLGLTYNQNPATNPWVDWFKAQLSR